MLGIEDGVVDALLKLSRSDSDAYFGCPAMRAGRLDLSPLGIHVAAAADGLAIA